MSDRDDEMMIAHHEAGHAVAMWLLELGVEHVAEIAEAAAQAGVEWADGQS